MRDKEIENIAEKARRIIKLIPFSKEEQIDFSTYSYGDPIVYYETRPEGIYQIIEERGNVEERIVAKNSDEMVAFFVKEAVWRYAQSYELAHRRKFESNLRQVHEIMEKCYHYIDPERKFVKETYEDEIHIYLDLFEAYRKTVQEYKQTYPEKYIEIKDDIDFIIDKKYADNPYGGMSNVPKSMSLVRERIIRIGQYDTLLKSAFDSYEKYFALLKVNNAS
jgi:hypothetical protein